MADDPQAESAESARASVDSGWIGREIEDRYRIVRLLGEGGMGAVFVAEHLRLQKEVALKVVRPEFAGNGEVAARFAREAMATAQFEHPNVASAIDYGTLPEGGAYFVLQLVSGESLRSLLDRERSLAWPRACELAAQIADALSAARAAGIVHRDLKPENVLVQAREDGGELAKILDFGIAHVRSNDANQNSTQLAGTQLTRVGTIVGTPGYMSPEQAVGEAIDHRTDIYALGVVLWECLAGTALWDAPDVPTLLGKQLSEQPRSISVASKRTDIPRELDALVLRMLARSAADRPQQAGEVRDALRQLVAQQSGVLGNPIARRFATLTPPQRRAVLAISVAFTVLVGAFILSPRASHTAKSGGIASAHEEKDSEPELMEVHKITVDQMMNGRSRKVRRDAARLLVALDDFDDFPEHIQLVARFEAAESCLDRNAAIVTLEESGDKAVLPALERILDAPKTGCGFLRLEDCYSCIRASTRKAIDTLRQ